MDKTMKRVIERGKWHDRERLPDAIYRCKQKENFTQISNSFIRDPEISLKAKGILAILLSNSDEWMSYVSTISSMIKEGRDLLLSGLAELEQKGYLKRIRYRNKITKKWKGSFWCYTDTANVFDYHKNLNILEQKGFEIFVKTGKINPQTEKAFMDIVNISERTTNGFAVSGKSDTKNTNSNKEEKAHAFEGVRNRSRINHKKVTPVKIDIPGYVPENGYYFCKPWLYRQEEIKYYDNIGYRLCSDKLYRSSSLEIYYD
jgi:hypothetical protein